MAEEPDVSLVVSGQRHEGWKSVSIHMGIEELAPTFQVSLTERWTQAREPMPIVEGDRVELSIGETLVLTGYVDDVDEDYDAQSHSVSVSGRTRTGDLVECAAIHKGGSIRGRNIKQIAELLCAPFGITVSLSEPGLDIGEAIKAFTIQDGESVFDSLNELARKEGILLLVDAKGNLVLARAASEPLGTVSVDKFNIKRGSRRKSMRERFSNYLIKSQLAGSDLLSGTGAAHVKATAYDDAVLRYRPLTIVDHGGTVALANQRATWERNTRAGRALVLAYDVRGWTHHYGVWTPNTLVRVDDERFNIDDHMLVTSVDLSRTLEQGRVATLELMARETFDVLKPPKPPKRKRGLAALL